MASLMLCVVHEHCWNHTLLASHNVGVAGALLGDALVVMAGSGTDARGGCSAK
jgi:hypothetical protein